MKRSIVWGVLILLGIFGALTGCSRPTMSADKRAVVRKFKQYTYTDPAYNNEKLMYSVFVPERFDGHHLIGFCQFTLVKALGVGDDLIICGHISKRDGTPSNVRRAM